MSADSVHLSLVIANRKPSCATPNCGLVDGGAGRGRGRGSILRVVLGSLLYFQKLKIAHAIMHDRG